MIVRLRAASEAVRNSLFFVPVLCVVLGLALAAGMLELDRRVRLEPAPSLLRFTVESARELLGTVAAAIITVSGIVFALTGLSVQLASSQFSPRVVRGFLRDRNAQVSIGFMVGTFTYSVVVLRAVRSVEGGPDVVPALSTALALGLTVAAVVAIVGFVSRTAHRLQSSQLIRGVAEETLGAVASQLPERGEGGSGDGARMLASAEPEWRVRALTTGWIAQISPRQLLELLPAGGVARVEVEVGQFVHPGRRLCTVWSEADHRDRLERKVNQAFDIEMSRTMQQDIGFGIRQIVDIALRALSPGVNDPTTAYECIVHLGAISYEILRRDLPPAEIAGEDGRRIILSRQVSHADFVAAAFDEIRQSAASLPSVAAALVETLAEVFADLAEDGIIDRYRTEPLVRQARLVLSGVEKECSLPEDAARVRDAAATLVHDSDERSDGPARHHVG
ncbi:MAG: DUF2254 domain-containing protein [Actinomycetota bacterium]|nr:DUF2254 domain-containing protein [Actinomycetota bacterium]